jgi:hypothetical protein
MQTGEASLAHPMLRRDYAARLKWLSWHNHTTSRFELAQIWSTISKLLI